MLFYFTFFILLALCSIVEVYFSKNKKDVWLIYYHFLIVIFLLATFKARGLGTDMAAYENFFKTRERLFQPSEFEFLFARFNEIVKLATNSYVLLLAIQAMIIYKLQDCVVKRWSIYPLTSLFYMWAINADYIYFVRQIVACYILFYSIFFIADRKFFKFILLVILATSIHISSVVFLPAYSIWKWKPRKTTYIILFSICVLFLPILFGKIIQVVIIALHFPAIIQQKVEIYFVNPTEYAKNLLALVKGIINQGFLLFVLLLDFNKYKRIQKDFVGLFNIAWLGAVIFCSALPIHIQIARFAYSYMLVYMILLPAIAKVRFNNKNTGLLSFIIILYYLGFRQLSFVLTSAPETLYHFVDSSQKLGY